MVAMMIHWVSGIRRREPSIGYRAPTRVVAFASIPARSCL
jgi:hypothetical protein